MTDHTADDRFILGEQLRAGLLDLATSSPAAAWSGSLAELIGALISRFGDEDASWLQALDASSLVRIAEDADLARDRLRFWRTAERLYLVLGESKPFGVASLGGRSADGWRRRTVELFAESGSQRTTEDRLLVEWRAALRAQAKHDRCRFCGLENGTDEQVHAQCESPLRRQDEAWTAAFLDLVRLRPEALPLLWPIVPTPPAERPSAEPTPEGISAQLRLFAKECLEYGDGLTVDRSSVFESWHAWCARRQVDAGTPGAFQMSVAASDILRAHHSLSWSGREIYSGAALLPPDNDDDISESDGTPLPEPDAPHIGLVRLFVREQCTSGPALEVPAGDLFAAFCRWRSGRQAMALTRPQFFGALRHVTPVTVTRPSGPGNRPRVCVGIALRPADMKAA
jgi:hypothetical protein